MEVQVLHESIIRIDAHGAILFLKGEPEIRELIRALTNSLFDLNKLHQKKLEASNSFDPNPQKKGPGGSGSILRESVEAGVQAPAEGGQGGHPKDPTVP